MAIVDPMVLSVSAWFQDPQIVDQCWLETIKAMGFRDYWHLKSTMLLFFFSINLNFYLSVFG